MNPIINGGTSSVTVRGPTSGAPDVTVKGNSKLQVFSWQQSSYSPQTLSTLTWVNSYCSVTSQADHVIAALSGSALGSNAVFLFRCMDSVFGGNPQFSNPSLGSNLGDKIANGLNISFERDYISTLFKTLKSAGIPIDRVVTDFEGGLNVFQIGDVESAIETVYDNPTAFAKLPHYIKDYYYPADIVPSPVNNPGSLAWNQFSAFFVGQAYKSAVIDPIHQIYGPQVVVGNYADMITSNMTLQDINGWNIYNNSVVSNISSPVCYFGVGNKFNTDRAFFVRDWRWYALMDCINYIRACSADKPIAPWIANPSFRFEFDISAFRQPWLWQQLIKHAVAGGVNTFYYFNADAPAADDAIADALFTQLSPSLPLSLSQISYTDDEIVSGNLVTTYSDFLSAVGVN
jgi:hypothetical protein